MEEQGFPFECTRQYNRTIVVKTHRKIDKQFDRAVLIIRSPYDALLAHSMYKLEGHTGKPSVNETIGGKLEQVVVKYLFT